MLYILYERVGRQPMYASVRAMPANAPKLPSIVKTNLSGPYPERPPKGDQGGGDVRDSKL